MKRYNHLFEKIVSIDNLYLAEKKARKNKGNRKDVQKFLLNRDVLLRQLQEMLIKEQYVTSEYSTFKIFEPKERIIFKLPFYPDRIVHHAIMNVLEPIWVSLFIKETYSCIKNRGIHKAVKDVKKALKDFNGTLYCLQLDIEKFYPRVDHDILKQIIRRKIKDQKLLNLLDGIIDSSEGVPIGNYLSQFFANVYLSYFDHWLKEVKHVKYYWRYADDIVILASNKAILHDLLIEINEYLTTKLNLKLKRNHKIFPVDSAGIDFLGYVFHHKYVLLRKGIKKRFCKRVAKINKHYKKITEEWYKQQICSWWGWCKYCNSSHLLCKLQQSFPFKIKFVN